MLEGVSGDYLDLFPCSKQGHLQQDAQDYV